VLTDDDDDRDVLLPEFSVDCRVVPGFPRHRITSDRVVWYDGRRKGSPFARWVRLWPKRVSGSGRHFYRLRHAGREHVRSVHLLYRAAFSPRPDLWLDRIGPKPPRPADMPRAPGRPSAPVPCPCPSPCPAPGPSPAPARPQPARPVELRVIPGFPQYAVGSDRSVWSSYAYGRRVPEPARPVSWRRRALADGGKRVDLWRDGRKVRRDVEEIYLAAFGGPAAGGPGLLLWADPFHEPQRGCTHGMARLDEAKVIEARRLRREGWIYADLAERYGVTAGTILAAVSGRTWGHVPMGGKADCPPAPDPDRGRSR